MARKAKSFSKIKKHGYDAVFFDNQIKLRKIEILTKPLELSNLDEIRR
jgi:hypothetical protein